MATVEILTKSASSCLTQHLVRIPSQGVDPLRAGHQVLQLAGQDGRPAPTGVDVDPDLGLELCADVSDRVL